MHALSVSSYNDDRFRRLLDGLKETNIGIIVCPNATLSNKQNRSVMVPMHNSITRVLDFLVEDIPVRIGTDNIEDFFPSDSDLVVSIDKAVEHSGTLSAGGVLIYADGDLANPRALQAAAATVESVGVRK